VVEAVIKKGFAILNVSVSATTLAANAILQIKVELALMTPVASEHSVALDSVVEFSNKILISFLHSLILKISWRC
jgi:hypothetical protein